MYHIKLYHAHTACSRVTLTALEQCGCPYEDELLNLRQGRHRSPEYLAVNPHGKVPALVVDGRVLTENGAIISWLHQAYPGAGLFPPASNEWERFTQLSDLFWLSATWHPYVRANKAPFMWTVGDVEPVRAKGRELLDGVAAELEIRLQDREWWYGPKWSIIDTYLWWAYINAEFGGYSIEPFDAVKRHRVRNEAHPALQRALAREAAALEQSAPQ